MVDLFDRREPADFMLLCDELERRGALEGVGGPAYLTALIDMVPTAVHVEYYGQVVERCAILRRLITPGGRSPAVGLQTSSTTPSWRWRRPSRSCSA